MAAWVDARTRSPTLPRDAAAAAALKKRITQLYDYERFGVPVKKGGRYFYTHNSGPAEPVGAVRPRRPGRRGPRQLIDPNGWSEDGATALAEWTPSEDGKLLAIRSRTAAPTGARVKVMDVATGKILPDELKWLKYMRRCQLGEGRQAASIIRASGAGGGRDLPERDAQPPRLFPQARHHAGGGPAGLCDARQPKLSHDAQVSDDGRWLVISTSRAGDENDVHVVDLRKPGAKPRSAFHRPREPVELSSATRATASSSRPTRTRR